MYSQSANRDLRTSLYSNSIQDINVLLLGPTGVGKSTFINAFVNYLTYDSLDESLTGEMFALIPCQYIYTDSMTFKDTNITIGRQDQFEKFGDGVHSATKYCRSFIFPIGNRKLRLIDTPGIGDTEGLERDQGNLQEIFKYIAGYEHLNAICILLKPNEVRLSVQLRYHLNEILRHLHVNAAKNIIFVFTNARSTRYQIGNTRRPLLTALEEYTEKHKVNVPFTRNNSFFFDNEAFLYFAFVKNKLRIEQNHVASYRNSWEHSTAECSRFLSYIVQCPPHKTRETLSLNDVEQLIRKLPRPLAETQKLIQENIQLAERYRTRVLVNPILAEQHLPQNNPIIKKLDVPQTVCASEKCRRVIDIDGDMRVEYTQICHDECYLNGVEQETLGHDDIQLCTSINPYTDLCFTCGCHWQSHIHISYIFTTNRTQLNQPNNRNSITTQKRFDLEDVNQRIRQLEQEAMRIQNIYTKLARFMHANALIPFNDAYVGYLDYYISIEDPTRQSLPEQGSKLERLLALKRDFERHLKFFKEELQELPSEQRYERAALKPVEVGVLIDQLYALPISGVQIREQVRGIQLANDRSSKIHEIQVELAAQAANSNVMRALVAIVLDR